VTDKPSYTIHLKEVETTNIGVSELMKFYAFAKQYTYKSVQLNLSTVNTLDANLSALILAIAHKLRAENKVTVFVLFADGMGIFFRNGLIGHLTGKGNANPYPDDRQSAIPLTTFNIDDDEKFCQYLRRDFFGHRGLEGLTTTTRTNLSTHYEEIFTNVGLHANTTAPIYCCGQYFPEKKMLKFTLVDVGDGFLKKIALKTTGQVKTDKDAILWATRELNTTKDIATYGPGGTGLKELIKYCATNNGSLHICSGTGYVNFHKTGSLEHTLPIAFKGTIVNLIFRNI
jgi:hypothetical protein